MTFLSRLLFASTIKHFLIGSFVAALLLRLSIILLFADPIPPKWQEHTTIAHNLYHGYGFAMHWPYKSLLPERTALMEQPPTFPGSYQPPLNPYIIYVFYLLFGETSMAIYLIMVFYALVHALLPVVTYYIALLLFTEKEARMSSLVALCFLPAAYSVISLSGSPLYAVTAMYFLYGCVSVFTSPSAWKGYLIAGIAGGVTALLRSEFLVLGSIVILVTAVTTAVRSKQARPMVLASIPLLCILIVGGVWVARNYQVYGRVLLSGTHTWHEIWRGNNKFATGITLGGENSDPMIVISPTLFPDVTRRIDSIPYDQHFEDRIDGVFRDETTAYMKANPGPTLLRSLEKAFYFFTFDPSHPQAKNPLYFAFTCAVSVLFITGMIRLANLHRGHVLLSPVIIILCFFSIYLLQISLSLMLPRYQIYVLSTILPLTGGGMHLLTRAVRRRA